MAADLADDRGGLAQVVAEAALLGRDERAQQALGPERVDGLLGEPGVGVDVGGVDRRGLAADPAGELDDLVQCPRGRRPAS